MFETKRYNKTVYNAKLKINNHILRLRQIKKINFG